jgi:pimeloyl-ACP methyl ester carboxylesterase
VERSTFYVDEGMADATMVAVAILRVLQSRFRSHPVMPKRHCERSILRVALAVVGFAICGFSICGSAAAQTLPEAATPAPASSTLAQPLAHGPSHEKVYLLRGFTNVLSPGIDQLASELRRRNISTTIANHAFSAALAQEALQDCKSGRVNSIVLVGHSFGASAALSMAESLKDSGIQVALIVTFDPVTKNSVPANVHRLENFYVSDGVGQPVQQGPRFRGALKNIEFKNNAELGHISVTTFPSIQKQVLRDILAANIRCNRV